MPPCLRVVEASACVNDWNSRRTVSAGMPMPVSVTENRSSTSRRLLRRLVTSTVMPPRSVNLMALLRRFVRIWRSRMGSPRRLAGRSSAMSTTSFSPRCSAVRAIKSVIEWTSSRRLNSTLSSSSLPDSTLA